jgi:hypothetical protein
LLVVAAVCILIVVGSWGLGESTSGVTERASVASAAGSLGLGAAVGAYVGAREAHRLREKAEQKQEDRERLGLLRLLYTEVVQNDRNVNYVAPLVQQPEYATTTLLMRGQYVHSEAWRATRVGLSQRLTSEQFALLSDYYKAVLLLEELVTGERGKRDKDSDYETKQNILDQAKVLLKALQEQGTEVQDFIRTQLPDVGTTDKLTERIDRIRQELP